MGVVGWGGVGGSGVGVGWGGVGWGSYLDHRYPVGLAFIP